MERRSRSRDEELIICVDIDKMAPRCVPSEQAAQNDQSILKRGEKMITYTGLPLPPFRYPRNDRVLLLLASLLDCLRLCYEDVIQTDYHFAH